MEKLERQKGAVSSRDTEMSLANRKPTGKQGAEMGGRQEVCEKHINDRNAKSQIR